MNIWFIECMVYFLLLDTGSLLMMEIAKQMECGYSNFDYHKMVKGALTPSSLLSEYWFELIGNFIPFCKQLETVLMAVNENHKNFCHIFRCILGDQFRQQNHI